MTMEDHIPNHPVKAPCLIQNVQGIAFLRADRNRIQDGRCWVLWLKPPRMVMKVEYMESPSPLHEAGVFLQDRRHMHEGWAAQDLHAPRNL